MIRPSHQGGDAAKSGIGATLAAIKGTAEA